MTRHVLIAASLPATPERLYDMYLNAKEHAAFTGAPVEIGAREGAAFSAFDGALTGTILHVEPARMIVQTWRSTNWPEDAINSTLILTFWPENDGGLIELCHINVPVLDFAGVSRGWEKYYWTPWRAYLEKRG